MQDDKKTVYEFIVSEEANFKTNRVPLTNSKDWNMHEHIERCTNVANGWFHLGKNDGERPYTDIVTPIINVAFRSEGFDVKDIVPYVNDADNYYKSFLIKKFHPQWARKNEIDTFIDDLVETSIIYDLALIKNVNNVRPEVVPLQSIAFCDQTCVLSGPICIKHQYSVSDLLDFKGKWDNNKIDEAVTMARYSKAVSSANDQEVKTPGKYIEVYELHGLFPKYWLKDEEGDEYVPQLHIITFYVSEDGKKNGITLFSGKETKPVFKALKIDKVKSFGRACGKSIVETLFEPQVWTNYSGIKIKALLDSAITVFQSSSDELGNQKLTNLRLNTILKHEPDHPVTKLTSDLGNITAFTNDQTKRENDARILGSASDAQLGTNPVSGTPFALQSLVVQEGQGIHEYRQGKIASFVADELYRDWILGYLVKEMNSGKSFSEELTLDELQEVSEKIAKNKAEKKVKEMILDGKLVTNQNREEMIKTFKDTFVQNGTRGFFESLKGELADIPVNVFVNIKGKQKAMAQNADKLTNILREILSNPSAFQQIPGIGKAFNELIENSGLSPIDFTQIVTPVIQTEQPQPSPMQPQEQLLQTK